MTHFYVKRDIVAFRHFWSPNSRITAPVRSRLSGMLYRDPWRRWIKLWCPGKVLLSGRYPQQWRISMLSGILWLFDMIEARTHESQLRLGRACQKCSVRIRVEDELSYDALVRCFYQFDILNNDAFLCKAGYCGFSTCLKPELTNHSSS